MIDYVRFTQGDVIWVHIQNQPWRQFDGRIEGWLATLRWTGCPLRMSENSSDHSSLDHTAFLSVGSSCPRSWVGKMPFHSYRARLTLAQLLWIWHLYWNHVQEDGSEGQPWSDPVCTSHQSGDHWSAFPEMSVFFQHIEYCRLNTPSSKLCYYSGSLFRGIFYILFQWWHSWRWKCH